ncbi:hypothetical protein [Sorangium cellulosum]|uniref:hypothetical protein n=1 Tax=Sorangium cellulosum TaxID=56 RepID=UPI001651A183|nr:hypothetical protein [Sorangium cellulosum]
MPPPPSPAFPKKKKPAITAKEAMKAKVQARAGKKAAKPAPSPAAERATDHATAAAREEPRASAAAKPRDNGAAKPRDAAPKSVRRDQAATPEAPAKKPGLLRRLLNLFRRSG